VRYVLKNVSHRQADPQLARRGEGVDIARFAIRLPRHGATGHLRISSSELTAGAIGIAGFCELSVHRKADDAGIQ
jgi:hypothetical protein